jgi:hypothetical protein
MVPTSHAPRQNRLVPLLAGCLLLVTGCRATRLESAGTTVPSGDLLYGRVTPAEPVQSFTFEGVESSLLDFRLASDDGSNAAPLPTVTDPEGQPVEIGSFVKSPFGAATLKVEGVVLRKTGGYRVTVANLLPEHQVFYRFDHQVRFPPILDLKLRLNSEQATPIYVAAPRGGVVAAKITPIAGSGLVPTMHGVMDPWGGRALDATQVPGGITPKASYLQDGSFVLVFVAPRPGIYTILAASKPGTPGEAMITADVTPPGRRAAAVWHTDAPAMQYGFPGGSGQPVTMR